MKPGRIVGGKYDKKYGRQLMKGLRNDGMSVEEVCQLWNINRTTYYRWIEIHEEFKEAHEYGERDVMAYWHRLTRAAASGQIKANAGVICFAMKNIAGIEWKDKLEVTNDGLEQIQRININVLPAPEQKPLLIEHEDVDSES